MSGPAILAVHLPDPAAIWRELGFTVEGTRVQAGATALTLNAPHGWTLSGQGPPVLSQIPTTWQTAPGDNPAPRHDNGVIAIDHVVLITDSPQRTRTELEAVGMQIRREVDLGERVALFVRHGEAILEVVGPSGEGSRIWGITFTTTDPQAATEILGRRLGRWRDAVQPGRRIAPLQPDPSLSLALALMTP